MSVDVSAATMALPEFRLSPGQTFAHRYDVLDVLGEGGMGAVYRVRDRELDEVVALKVLRPEIAASPDAIERFRREVKLARKVTHPNVARTYDLGGGGATRFLTMELIEGVSLADRTRKSRLSLGDALRIASEICRGLAAAHAAGVVHRDLKPENVLLAGAGANGPLSGAERVVITDFGIARLTHETPDQSTTGRALTVGVVVGTPAYMAPEQVMGQDPDGRADVYALGVLLFELLTGQLPFNGDNAYAVAAARLKGVVPDARELDGSLPDGVASIVAEAMAPRREDRPDAARMLEALESLRGAGGGARDGLSPLPTFSTSSFGIDTPQPARARTVAIVPITAADGAGSVLARDLSATLADAVSRLRALRVVPPGVVLPELTAHARDEGTDLVSLAKALRADRLLSGTLRAQGERVRVNLRMVDPQAGVQTWGERYDGSLEDPFALEDALVRGASDALRAMLGAEAAPGTGPSDPAVRALYDKARESYHRFLDPSSQTQAIELLRRAHNLAPDDASVMSLLGASLMRLALIRREEPALFTEAEDWALRAHNADPSVGETYATLGLVRFHQGQLKASLRAFREALARNPRHAEASSYVGRLLAESGHPKDGLKRMEHAVRLEPTMTRVWLDIGRVHALLGDHAACDDALARAEARGAPPGWSLPLVVRMCLWYPERERIDRAMKLVEDANLPADSFVLRAYAPALRKLHAGEPMTLEDDALTKIAPGVPSLTNRAFLYQVSAEFRAGMGLVDAALESLQNAASLPFVDLLWLDRCPPLASVRDTPGFARVRAMVAGRVAELWA